jgi:putative phage-type endonuclease
MQAQFGEWSKSLDALISVNEEWSKEIDLHNEYLSNLFDQFGNEDMWLVVEDMLAHLDAYVCDNPLMFSSPDFHEVVHDVLHEYFEGLDFGPDLDMEADALCCFCESLYFKCVAPPRECDGTFIRKPPNVAVIDAKLAHIRAKPQPDQRTPEWYRFRHDLITASNAWKTFESQACRNQLIYEKCKPVVTVHAEKEYVNTASPMHWGHKYEPVTRMIYEHLYNTRVADFGCLQHDVHSFLGASPDGINVDPASQRYGRMLEIKNIVNRDITGIPKKEYWIQMQLQMETADLNECDFFETQFSEEGDEGDEGDEGCKNEAGNTALMTGTMIYFMKDGRPHYEYAPIGCNCNSSELEAWFDQAMERNQAHTWIKTIHWRLEKMSCVLVLRNKTWFQHAIKAMDELWQTVLQERNNPDGYEHRGPKRKSPSAHALLSNPSNTNERKCRIDVANLEMEEEEEKDEKDATHHPSDLKLNLSSQLKQN